MCLPLANLDSLTLAKGEHLGFAWQIVPNSMGYRCGYIRVEPGHPWFGLPYNDVGADVHGGLTFGAHGTTCPTHGPEAEYWYGFDCAHVGDAPDESLLNDVDREYYSRYSRLLRSRGDTIKDTAYVERECRSLCEQAQAAMTAVAS